MMSLSKVIFMLFTIFIAYPVNGDSELNGRRLFFSGSERQGTQKFPDKKIPNPEVVQQPAAPRQKYELHFHGYLIGEGSARIFWTSVKGKQKRSFSNRESSVVVKQGRTNSKRGRFRDFTYKDRWVGNASSNTIERLQ